MAWGNKKEMIIAERAALQREVELLRDQLDEKKTEITELRGQLKYTQEALIAKESPEAYRTQKWEEEQARHEEAAPLPDGEEAQVRTQLQKINALSAFASEVERPLFKDADDMIQLLTPARGVPGMETESLHGNAES